MKPEPAAVNATLEPSGDTVAFSNSRWLTRATRCSLPVATVFIQISRPAGSPRSNTICDPSAVWLARPPSSRVSSKSVTGGGASAVAERAARPITRCVTADAKTIRPSRLTDGYVYCCAETVRRRGLRAGRPSFNEMGSSQRSRSSEKTRPSSVQVAPAVAARPARTGARRAAPVLTGALPSSGTHHQSRSSTPDTLRSYRPRRIPGTSVIRER